MWLCRFDWWESGQNESLGRMFVFVKSRANIHRPPARTFTLIGLISVLAVLAAACGSGDSATPAPSPRPTGIASGAAPAAATPAAGLVTVAVPQPPSGATPLPSGGTVPADCETAAPTSEIAALVARDLLVAPGTPALSDGGTTLVCRYLVGKDAPMDRTILLTISGYASEAVAVRQDAGLRAAITAQGGVFTPATGVGDEAYTFDFPAISGISARLGAHVVSLGIGKSVQPQPTIGAVTTLVQRILADVGR